MRAGRSRPCRDSGGSLAIGASRFREGAPSIEPTIIRASAAPAMETSLAGTIWVWPSVTAAVHCSTRPVSTNQRFHHAIVVCVRMLSRLRSSCCGGRVRCRLNPVCSSCQWHQVSARPAIRRLPCPAEALFSSAWAAKAAGAARRPGPRDRPTYCAAPSLAIGWRRRRSAGVRRGCGRCGYRGR